MFGRLTRARQYAPSTEGWVRASTREIISYGRTSCCRQPATRTIRGRGDIRCCTGRARRHVSAKWDAQTHSHGLGPVRILCLIRDNHEAHA